MQTNSLTVNSAFDSMASGAAQCYYTKESEIISFQNLLTRSAEQAQVWLCEQIVWTTTLPPKKNILWLGMNR